MKRHAAPGLGWLRRLWGLWPDRNPLRRRCDRAEAAIVAGLVAAFVIGAPLAALAAGRWAYDSTARAERAELSALHQVPAVLLTTATVHQAWSPAIPVGTFVAYPGANVPGVPIPGQAHRGSIRNGAACPVGGHEGLSRKPVERRARAGGMGHR